jgi:tripartite-type tricarboxylate transporter receptor subunit TctC
MFRIPLLVALAAGLASQLVPGATALAQKAEKPVRFLVGFPAGALTDLSARALAGVAARYLEQQVLVVNVPGAAGALAINELVKHPPDGSTVAMMTTSYKALVVHQQVPPFDLGELKTLLGYAEFRQLLFVKSDSPFANFDELIAYGRKNPGTIKFGHSGTGTSLHLQGLLFFRSAGVDAPDVPFKGSNDYVNAILGGHLPAAIIDIAGVRQLARAGTVKLVVAFVAERFPEFPEVPTAREKGFPGLEVFNPQLAVMVRSGMPPDRARRLHDAFKRATEDPEFIKSLEAMGLKGGYIAPEAVDDTVAKAEAKAIPILKELKLHVR